MHADEYTVTRCAADGLEEDDNGTTTKNREIVQCKSVLFATHSSGFDEVKDGPHGCYKYGGSLYYNAGAEVETGHNGDCEIVNFASLRPGRGGPHVRAPFQ